MISQPVTPQHLLTQPAAACCLAAVSRIPLRAYDLATPDLATPPLGRYPLVAIPTWFAPSRDMQELTQRRAVQDHYILWFKPLLQRILVSRFRERNRFLRLLKKLLKNSKKQR